MPDIAPGRITLTSGFVELTKVICFEELPSAECPPRRRVRDVLGFAAPHWRAISVIIALMLSVASINAAEPLVLKMVFDGVGTSSASQPLLTGIVALTAIMLARELIDGSANWLTWRTRIGFQYALLEATVGKIYNTPLRIQRGEGIGALMTRLDRSIQGLTQALTLLLFNILPSVIFMIAAISIMFGLDWRLALVVLIFAPMPALIAVRAAPEQTRRDQVLLDRWARIYSRFNEILAGIVIVRSFAMEYAERSASCMKYRWPTRWWFAASRPTLGVEPPAIWSSAWRDSALSDSAPISRYGGRLPSAPSWRFLAMSARCSRRYKA